MYIVNPTEQQKIKWYQCSYFEGDYIIRSFKLSPVFIDDTFMYFVRTDEFDKAVDGVPIVMKGWTLIKKIKIRKFWNLFKTWRKSRFK